MPKDREHHKPDKGHIKEKKKNKENDPAAIEDFVLDPQSTSKDSVTRKNTTYPIGWCSIYSKKGPVLCLSKKCRWHGAACSQYFHRVYVANAQKYWSKIYPLTCLHPMCDQHVQAAQLEKNIIFLRLLSKSRCTIQCLSCPRLKRLMEWEPSFALCAILQGEYTKSSSTKTVNSVAKIIKCYTRCLQTMYNQYTGKGHSKRRRFGWWLGKLGKVSQLQHFDQSNPTVHANCLLQRRPCPFYVGTIKLWVNIGNNHLVHYGPSGACN